MLTLRQIEIIRAIMVTGTISGAAKLLNISAPGISRLMKYTEDMVGVPLFNRRHGRYVPTPEARNVFDLLDNIHRKVEDLQTSIDRLGSGEGRELSFASVPSIANVMVPRAVEQVKRRFPDIKLEIDILKIEQSIDYLLLGRGELVAISSRFDHSIIDFAPLATGRLVCIVPPSSELAAKTSIRPWEIASHMLIGIDPNDPYGRIMTEIFRREQLSYSMNIKTRFGTTVCSLVAAGLGIAVIDEFTVAHGMLPGVKVLEIEAETTFHTYAAYRNDTPLSVYAEALIELLRAEMKATSA
ncbi:transcriptional regulator, LysR family [Rhizobium sp. CF080]|uniref:LysR family transcriptional regulator n=1 Tax=Rhizobium sp. (strain CF080) TaxID=1144310 RepID=UPI00027192E2|nr:LysR family transcriptional regulator [Rhizobium sp. CF080]EUB99310.1 transcriptional regulator, LysR family [Rhizobium sp. CF080]